MNLFDTWQFYAGASAVFAALTAIFGKLGVTNINSNFATFLRTVVILLITAGLVSLRSEWQSLRAISARTYIFLTLSAIATGASWLCYYHALKLGPASRVAPVDKLSVVFVMILAYVFFGEPMTWTVALGGLLVGSGAVLMVW